DDSLVLPNGTSATCTIDNDDQPATLTLVKVVDDRDTGATHVPGDWTLTANGPTDVSGPGNSPQVTDQTVDAGSYALSESGEPDGDQGSRQPRHRCNDRGERLDADGDRSGRATHHRSVRDQRGGPAGDLRPVRDRSRRLRRLRLVVHGCSRLRCRLGHDRA